jgi:hypothetical protein
MTRAQGNELIGPVIGILHLEPIGRATGRTDAFKAQSSRRFVDKGIRFVGRSTRAVLA